MKKIGYTFLSVILFLAVLAFWLFSGILDNKESLIGMMFMVHAFFLPSILAWCIPLGILEIIQTKLSLWWAILGWVLGIFWQNIYLSVKRCVPTQQCTELENMLISLEFWWFFLCIFISGAIGFVMQKYVFPKMTSIPENIS